MSEQTPEQLPEQPADPETPDSGGAGGGGPETPEQPTPAPVETADPDAEQAPVRYAVYDLRWLRFVTAPLETEAAADRAVKALGGLSGANRGRYEIREV